MISTQAQIGMRNHLLQFVSCGRLLTPSTDSPNAACFICAATTLASYVGFGLTQTSKWMRFPSTMSSRSQTSDLATRHPRQAGMRTSTASGASPIGLGLTVRPPAVPTPGTSADLRIAAPFSVYSWIRQRQPRART